MNARDYLYTRVLKNGIWLYLLQIFNTVVPLLTLPYITRILGKNQYGVFSIALNIVSYLQVLVEYGFAMSATRKVALNNSDDINKIFSTVIGSRILLLCMSIIISGVYVFLRQQETELCFSFVILLICLFGYCIQMNWLFQGMQEMQYISIVNIVARSISVLCIFVFVKNKSDLYKYCLFYSITPLISGIIGIIFAKRKFKLRFVRVKMEDIIHELKDGFFVFTTQLSSKVFGAIGLTFLSIFATNSEVGVFSAIQKIINIVILGWSPIAQILYPITSRKLHKDFDEGIEFVYKIRKKILLLFTIFSLIISLSSKVIVNIIYGEEYLGYYYWIIPLSVWLIIAINNNFLGVQILLGSGYDAEYSRCFQFSVFCTVLVNAIIIYTLKGDGAAVAPMISELILYLLLKVQISKIRKY